MTEERRIDVTHVPPGALDRMAKSDARPSPKLQAAIERVRQRLRGVIETPHCERTVYHMADHSSWGNTIQWFRNPGRDGVGQMVGWMGTFSTPPQPEIGDRIVCAMQSGRDAVFEVANKEHVYHLGGPHDMFYADVRFKGYADELEDAR